MCDTPKNITGIEVKMEHYKCPDCGGEEAVERVKLQRVHLTIEFPKYEQVKILRCATCNTEWPLPQWEIMHSSCL